MKLINSAAGSLLLAIAPLAAHAEDMSYSYVNLDYTDVAPDQGPSGDGVSLRGSVGFATNYFVFAEYGMFDVDVVDVDLTTVGLGGHFSVSDNLDFVGRAGYLELDISAPGFSDSQDGWLVSAGLRSRVGNHVELEGSVMQRELGDAGDDTVFTVGGRYHFNDLFAIGAEYQTGNDVEFIYAGVRISF
jgi:hypothetical protein